jgi:short subunit dehydrogenase-like uncharacterized protein
MQGSTDRMDVVVYGATGYTARHLIHYLADHPHQPAWAVAGRRRAALENLSGRPAHTPVIVAALDDPAALRAMTERARVVLNLAGPYRPHAEALVAACIDTGTHYADLSGEIGLTRELQDRHHARAVESGVTVVPSSGYEAVPFDLLVHALHERFRADDGSRLQTVDVQTAFTYRRHPLRVGLGVSGGTLATTVGFAHDHGLSDPFALVSRAGDRSTNAIDLRARRDTATGDWLLPLAPAPFVNPAVIHRTNELLGADGYAPGFAYREAFNATRTLGGIPGAPRLMAQGFSAMMRGIVALSEGRGGRVDRLSLWALKRLGPRPGRGPREATLDMLGYRLDAHGISETGRVGTARLDADGNPGYRSTPKILAEVGLALAAGRSRAGVVTPAIALGSDFLDELGAAGVTYSIDVGVAATRSQHQGPLRDN